MVGCGIDDDAMVIPLPLNTKGQNRGVEPDRRSGKLSIFDYKTKANIS